MSGEWTWVYDPDVHHVTAGLPAEVVTEVERLAGQLLVLETEATNVGRGRVHGGGLRTLDIFGGRGFFVFLVVEHIQMIAVVRITWAE